MRADRPEATPHFRSESVSARPKSIELAAEQLRLGPAPVLPPIAVLVGLCGHGLAVARALHRQGVTVIGLEQSHEPPGTRTNSASVQFTADVNSDSLVDALLSMPLPQKQVAPKPVLLLTNDRMVAIISRHIDAVSQRFFVSWEASAADVLRLLKKDAIEAQCRSSGLNYPKSALVETMADLPQLEGQLKFPIIFKPAQPISAFKTIVVNSLAEAHSHAALLARCLPVVAQEFIAGGDDCIHFGALMLKDGLPVSRFEGRKLRSRPMGHTTVAISDANDEVHRLAVQFFAGLQMNGPVSLELKKDPDGKFWVIEPTVGRTDFWLDVCVHNGVNLPLAEYALGRGDGPAPMVQTNETVWINGQRDPYAYLWLLVHYPGLAIRKRIGALFIDFKDFLPAAVSLRDQALAAVAWVARKIVKRVRAANEVGEATHSSSLLPRPALSSGPGMARLSVETCRLGKGVPADVRQFFEEFAHPNIELRLEWFELLSDHAPALTAAARLMVLRDGGRCIAVWPVQVGREAGALGNYFTALYEPVHGPDVDVARLSMLVSALRAECRGTGVLRFGPMDPESAAFATVELALKKAGYTTSRYFRFGNWYLPCAKLSWQCFYAGRPGILRSTIRRMHRRFTHDGGRIEILTGGPQLESAIDAYRRVYAASWKHEEPLQDFVSALVRQSAQLGRLRFAIAWLKSEPIAAQIWIVGFGRAEIFKLAYDDAHKRYSPGTLLTAALLEHVIDVDKVAEVDYLIGDDPYKSMWMTHRRERWGIVAFDTKTVSGVIGAVRQTVSSWFR